MSAKRSAPQNIDEKTLEHQANTQKKEQPTKQTNQQPLRDIVTVKKQGENGATKVDETKAETTKPATTNLFSGLFTNNGPSSISTTPVNGSGLFSNTTGSLFANNTGSGLFTNNKTTTTGLFGNNGATSTQPKTGGLFSSTSSSTTGGSIFNFQGGIPPIKNTGASLFGAKQQNDQDDSGDSAELQAAQNLQADPSKSTVSYKYQQTCRLIVKQKAFKFKKIGGDLIENVDVVVTQDKQSQLYYITVQLPATKKSIYTGLLLPNKSQVKHLNNKKENVQVSAFMIVNKKPQQAILRCQFQKEQQGIQLHDTIDQIVKGTYVYKQSSQQTEKKVEKSQEKKQATVQTKQDN